MQNQHFASDKKIALYTVYASKLLRCTQKELKKSFLGYPTCFTKYLDKDIKNKILEVELEEENLTISCWLDRKKQCYSLFLFPYPTQAIHYALYYNNHYLYDFNKKCWVLPGFCIEIHQNSSQSGFRFYIP